MGRAGLEPALLQQELGPKPSAYANFAICPFYTETKIMWHFNVIVFAAYWQDSDRLPSIFHVFFLRCNYH